MTEANPPKRLTNLQLREAGVITVVGVKLQSSLKDFVPVARAIGAGVLVRDRSDSVSFVFKDIRTRTRAFEELESGEARKLLRKFSQWGSFYIAPRPVARVAFKDIESLEEPVFDTTRRIYLEDEFKPVGFDSSMYNQECASTSYFPPLTPSTPGTDFMTEFDFFPPTSRDSSSPSSPLMCQTCRRLYTPIPG